MLLYLVCTLCEGEGLKCMKLCYKCLAESLEVRTRGKHNMMGVPYRLLHQEVVLGETFHKQLEEARRSQTVSLMGHLNCHNIFWKTLTYAMSNAYIRNM